VPIAARAPYGDVDAYRGCVRLRPSGWDGEISIAKNTIRVVTTRKGPADETGARETITIVARRP
jgi:hypothetical protein